MLRAGLRRPGDPRGRSSARWRWRASSGTLSTRLPALRGRVKGKTGTTDLACTLSGVIGGTVAFAVLENGSPVSSWAARAAQDRFVTILATGPA